jgi:hypothetical protein
MFIYIYTFVLIFIIIIIFLNFIFYFIFLFLFLFLFLFYFIFFEPKNIFLHFNITKLTLVNYLLRFHILITTKCHGHSESLSSFRTIVPSRPDASLSTVPSVRRTCLTVRTPVRPSIIRLDDVHFLSGPLLYREATVPACTRLDVSAARLDTSQ